MFPKVLFVNQAADFGGAELFLRDLIITLADNRIKHDALFFDEGPILDELKSAGIQTKAVSFKRSALSIRRKSGLFQIARSLLGLFIPMCRIVSEIRRYDVICANSQKAMFITGVCAIVVRKPLVWILHDIISEESFGPIMRRLIVFASNNLVDVVVANSIATKNALIKCGVINRKIEVIYNGFDVKRIPLRIQDDSLGQKLRNELGFTASPIIGMFGRLSKWKGQHVIINALELLPDAQLIIVGEAIYDNHEYKYELIKRARELGISDRIRFLGLRKDVSALMAAVDVVVHTSIEPEPFGRVVVEAMLQQRPVVATGLGGVTEIINHGVSGLLVKPNDPSVLAESVQLLLQNKLMADELAVAGHAYVSMNFAIDEMAQKIQAVFYDLSVKSSL